MLTERKIDGQMVRGFVLEFDKRYITLAPVATVVGLAFQAVDPSLPEGRQQLGITIALIPVPTPGLEIGRRHRPMNSAFMNGPVRREDDHGLHVLRNTGRALLGGGFRGQAPQGLRAETARISRLSAQFALTADLAMGLLGGQLKPLELLSARLGDILSALYLASACLWRYEVEGNVRLLPVARAAVAHQMDTAQHALVDLHANLGPPVLRLLWPLLRLGAHRRRPVADRQLLALAESLRDDPALVDALCPDVVIPRQGGLADLARALALSKVVKDGLPALNKVLRRTRSLQEAAASARNPAAALACLQATDPVIPVDDFEA